MAYDYEYFKKEILALTTIDLNSYKEKQMKRRIDTLIAKHKIVGYDKYLQALKNDKALFEEFVNYITINVSEFYRNPDQWKVLEEEIFPQLLKANGKSLKIWSAACSTGDEPYSLVMCLSKFVPLSNIKVIATDIDKQIIEKAKKGEYNEKYIKGIPQEYLTKYFNKIDDKTYRISDEIKRCVEFYRHDLLKDPYPEGCHIIICRNVMIYFTEEAKTEIYKKFNESLKKDCYLFV